MNLKPPLFTGILFRAKSASAIFRSLICLFFITGTMLAHDLPVKDWIWEVESPDHKPSLAYPIAYVLTANAIGIVSLNAMDRDDTGFDRPSARNFSEAWSRGPVFDDDEWYFNYLGHPLWGSDTFLRARSQGFSSFHSFLFSTGASVLWEFGFESWSVRPSYQDLMVTSTTGWLIGELRYNLKRRILASDQPHELLSIVIQPLQLVAENVGRLFGCDWTDPFHPHLVLLLIVDPLQTVTEHVGRLFGQDWSEPAYRKIPVHAQDDALRVNLDVAMVEGDPGLVLHFHKKF